MTTPSRLTARPFTPEEQRARESEDRLRRAQAAQQAAQQEGLPFPAVGGTGGLTLFPTYAGPDGVTPQQYVDDHINAPPHPGPRDVVYAGGRQFLSGPSEPVVPGAIAEAHAGPGAHNQITNEQVAQWLARPGQMAGRGPGQRLEGVRVETQREQAQRAEEQRQAEADQARFDRNMGEAMGHPDAQPPAGGPLDNSPFAHALGPDGRLQTGNQRALARQEMFEEKARGELAADADARAQEDKWAKEKGHKDAGAMRDSKVPPAKAARDWAKREYERNRGYYDSQGIGIGDLRAKYTEAAAAGGTASEIRARLAASEQQQAAQDWRDTVQPMGPNQVSKERRVAAVQAEADIYNNERRLRGPNAMAYYERAMADAQDDRERGVVMINFGMRTGNKDMVAQGTALMRGAQDQEAVGAIAAGKPPGPGAQMRQDRQAIADLPVREQLAGWRDMYRAQQQPGVPADPQAEAAFVAINGRPAASTAAAGLVIGGGEEGSMGYLNEWTQAWLAGAAGANGVPTKAHYEQWIRQLGIADTVESANLWRNLTGVNPGFKNRPSAMLEGAAAPPPPAAGGVTPGSGGLSPRGGRK